MFWQGIEKRRFPRIALPCRIDINLPNQLALNVTTDNLGSGGIKFLTNENLKVLTVVELELFLLTGDSIKCKARVIWNVKKTSNNEEAKDLFDIGLEFLDIKGSDKKLIVELVEALLKS